MSGVKGKSGRKKNVSRLVNEALERVDQELPNIFQALIDRALDGDREAQIYLIDRRLGKPKAVMDIEGGEELGAHILLQIGEAIAKRRLEEGITYAAIEEEKQGQDEGNQVAR